MSIPRSWHRPPNARSLSPGSARKHRFAVDLLIQTSLEILLGTILRYDRILIVNLSSTTGTITFVAWRRLVFPSVFLPLVSLLPSLHSLSLSLCLLSSLSFLTTIRLPLLFGTSFSLFLSLYSPSFSFFLSCKHHRAGSQKS